jgi:hypothetical protein
LIFFLPAVIGPHLTLSRLIGGWSAQAHLLMVGIVCALGMAGESLGLWPAAPWVPFRIRAGHESPPETSSGYYIGWFFLLMFVSLWIIWFRLSRFARIDQAPATHLPERG